MEKYYTLVFKWSYGQGGEHSSEIDEIENSIRGHLLDLCKIWFPRMAWGRENEFPGTYELLVAHAQAVLIPAKLITSYDGLFVLSLFIDLDGFSKLPPEYLLDFWNGITDHEVLQGNFVSIKIETRGPTILAEMSATVLEADFDLDEGSIPTGQISRDLTMISWLVQPVNVSMADQIVKKAIQSHSL